MAKIRKTAEVKIEQAEVSEVEKLTDGLVDRLTSKEGGRLFEALQKIKIEKETAEFEIEGQVIEVINLDKADLLAAIVMFSRIMENEKNEMGYRDFIAMIDEFEFMFLLSYMTNIGHRGDLGGYMKIHELFDATGLSDDLYSVVANEYEIARAAFARLYKLWEGEYIATSRQIVELASPGSELAARFLSMMDTDDTQDVDIEETIRLLQKTQGLTGEEVPEKPISKEPKGRKGFKKIIPMDPAKLRVLGEEE